MSEWEGGGMAFLLGAPVPAAVFTMLTNLHVNARISSVAFVHFFLGSDSKEATDKACLRPQ